MMEPEQNSASEGACHTNTRPAVQNASYASWGCELRSICLFRRDPRKKSPHSHKTQKYVPDARSQPVEAQLCAAKRDYPWPLFSLPDSNLIWPATRALSGHVAFQERRREPARSHTRHATQSHTRKHTSLLAAAPRHVKRCVRAPSRSCTPRSYSQRSSKRTSPPARAG